MNTYDYKITAEFINNSQMKKTALPLFLLCMWKTVPVISSPNVTPHPVFSSELYTCSLLSQPLAGEGWYPLIGCYMKQQTNLYFQQQMTSLFFYFSQFLLFSTKIPDKYITNHVFPCGPLRRDKRRKNLLFLF